MKNIATKLLLASTTVFLFTSEALAGLCGAAPLDPCEVPEPSTAYLFVGAAAVAALVVKFRKK